MKWLLVLVVAAVVAVILVICSKQKGVPGTSSADVTNQLKPLVQQILGSEEITKQQAQDTTDKIAREVITANLAAGKSKEELRKWCKEVLKQLNDYKQGLSNDQKIKFQAAIDAVKKVCDELLPP